jgi:DNA-binding transcriptional MerR regulator
MLQQLDLFGNVVEPPVSKASSYSGPKKPAVIEVPVAAEKPTEFNEAVIVAAKPSTGAKRGRKSLKDTGEDPTVLRDLETVRLDKAYYSIREVAQMFRVNNSLIRYWENEFNVLQPKKNRKGDRLFRPEDIQHLKVIYHLLRERKYTIEGAKQKLKDDKRFATRNFEMVQSLQQVRQFLVSLKDQL